MKEIRIYFEGGKEDDEDIIDEFQKGLIKFIKTGNKHRSKRKLKIEAIPCGPRSKAHMSFINAIIDHPDSFNILLVDSERPVTKSSPWQHLREIPDRMETPQGATDKQCHLMVEAMEAWIITDVESLKLFYEQGFNEKEIPVTDNVTNDVEKISKAKLLKSLEEATIKSKGKKYHKTRHAPKLLQIIDPLIVREKASYCERFFKTIEGLEV